MWSDNCARIYGNRNCCKRERKQLIGSKSLHSDGKSSQVKRAVNRPVSRDISDKVLIRPELKRFFVSNNSFSLQTSVP